MVTRDYLPLRPSCRGNSICPITRLTAIVRLHTGQRAIMCPVDDVLSSCRAPRTGRRLPSHNWSMGRDCRRMGGRARRDISHPASVLTAGSRGPWGCCSAQRKVFTAAVKTWPAPRWVLMGCCCAVRGSVECEALRRAVYDASGAHSWRQLRKGPCMASKRKQGTLAEVGRAVADAAKTAIGVAEDYVVKPVSNALGLTTKKPPKRAKKKAPAKRAAAPSKRSAATRKRSAAPRKRSAAPSKRSAAPSKRATKTRTTAKRPATAGQGVKRKRRK